MPDMLMKIGDFVTLPDENSYIIFSINGDYVYLRRTTYADMTNQRPVPDEKETINPETCEWKRIIQEECPDFWGYELFWWQDGN